MSERILLGFAAALGSGLLIGIERERRKGRGPHRALAGVRTFSLAAVAGAGARSTGQDILVIAGAALIVVLAGISYWRDRSRDPGVTTEMALFVTYILGVVAMGEPALAAGGAVVVTTLLASRSSLHRFSIDVHVVCRRSFWGIGCAVSAALAGFFDVHAAATSVLSLASKGTVPRAELVTAVLLVFSTNTISKLVAALSAGGFAYGIRVAAGLLLVAAAIWAPVLRLQH